MHTLYITYYYLPLLTITYHYLLLLTIIYLEFRVFWLPAEPVTSTYIHSHTRELSVHLFVRDITALARAAVSGDESALDMFNWKKNLGNRPSHFGAPAEALGFYVGTEEGNEMNKHFSPRASV